MSATAAGDQLLRCRVCGRTWKGAGDAKTENCPDCGSQKVATTAIIAGTAEYVTADRSKGYAIEDIRVGKIAQWAGLITSNQYAEALNIQRQAASGARAVAPLGDVLVKMGALKRNQVEAVLRARGGAWQDASEDALGEMIVEKKLLSNPRLIECKKAQIAFAENGQTPPPLALLLYEKRTLSEAEIEALLGALARRGRGLAAMVQADLVARPSTLDKALGPKGSVQRKARVLGVLAAIPILVVLALSVAGGEPVNVATQCEKCKSIKAAPVDSDWPLACTNCKAKAVYPLTMCLRCGTKFIAPKINAIGVKCPKCRYDRHQDLTSDVNEAEILKQIKEKSPEKKAR